MKSVYVVLSIHWSPIMITYPKPVAVFVTRREAQEFVKEKNNKAKSNKYGFTRVKFFTFGEAL